jgi:uridine kinase
MKELVKIYCKNTKSYHNYPFGTSLKEIAEDLNVKLAYPIVAARVNYKVEDLNFYVYKPKDIEFIDASDAAGMRVYVRTLCMIMSKAVDELIPDSDLTIQHHISKGYYCRLEHFDGNTTQELIDQIKHKMSIIVAQGIPIVREEQQTAIVKELFSMRKHQNTKTLFESLGIPYCRYYRIGNYIDYYNGVLLPSTGYVTVFDLVPYYDSMLLVVPDKENPLELGKVEMLPKMNDIFKEFRTWNKILKMTTVGEFNKASRSKQHFNLIKVSEALHEKKVAQIADMIQSRDKKVKLVLISGPSSSGKTTFSKRLSIQLMVSGLKPVTLSLDNYFVDREYTPIDEKGDWDFEHLQALDLQLFNKHLTQLFNGEEVEIPIFNFETGKRAKDVQKMRMGVDDVLVIEGIHGLNPELITDVSNEFIFKIYVSALTTIAIDNHNWIPTSDTRLLRRIIRDYRYRSYSARDTIARWPSVRRGEEKWIFPFQENADVMFNSALLFELAVLKKYAEPILAEVQKSCDEYAEAHRLLKFLNLFISIPDKEIPPTSLLREFVGGSSFSY